MSPIKIQDSTSKYVLRGAIINSYLCLSPDVKEGDIITKFKYKQRTTDKRNIKSYKTRTQTKSTQRMGFYQQAF